MNLLLVDDEIAMLHIMEKAIDWKKEGNSKRFLRPTIRILHGTLSVVPKLIL